MTDKTLLILDDDPDVAIAARLLLRRRFERIVEVREPGLLWSELERAKPALLLLDMNFTGGRADGGEGLAVLRRLMAQGDGPPVVVMTAYADLPLAVEAVKLGAFDFIAKPWDNVKLLATVDAALASRIAPPRTAASALIGSSPAMVELRSLIACVAPTEANVLILGENGVGKELVARAVHEGSRRSGGSFLAVDMGALPESTFESELFGHRKGSFTDARSDRAGRFQAAKGGTLFLDEIGNMALAGQAKLLTALERREVSPVGADKPEAIDVRIVSATNLDEARLVDPSVFRADLLYRLNTIVLRVPPLRARSADIGTLAEHYLGTYATQYGKPPRRLSTKALAVLQAHPWPGNVRALRHACERAVILAPGSEYEAADFGLGPVLPQEKAISPDELAGNSLALLEREAVAQAVRAADGNISKAAKVLGVSRAALYRKLEKHGL
jgi:DNA-binding NtrC family response regulator